MTIFKNNLWTLFFLILLGGLVLLGTILFFRWQAIVSEEEHYHGARAELVGQSVDSILRTQELVLDVIGRELLNQDAVLSGSRKIPLLDRILAANPVLVGFGLARPDGTLVRVSSNLDLASLPNLRTNPKTRDTFIRALSSGAMVLGRTYFVDALGSWVIPIRKAIRSETGDVIALMTAGLRLGDGDTVFDETLHDTPTTGLSCSGKSTATFSSSQARVLVRSNTGRFRSRWSGDSRIVTGLSGTLVAVLKA